MSAGDVKSRLAGTPVTSLSIWTAPFRRRVKAAGFSDVTVLFSLSDDEIDGIFDFDDADTVIAMKRSYEADPAGFADMALAARERRAAPEAASRPKPSARRLRASEAQEVPPIGATLWFASRLAELEGRAAAELDRIADHDQAAMVYQAFGELGDDLDSINAALFALFEHYRGQQRRAVAAAAGHFPDCLVVFIADLARKVFDGKNLWGTLCEEIGLTNSSAQSMIKEAFAERIEQRGMPVYGRDEHANHYYYTALLHGGLSESMWEVLWRRTLFPVARALASDSPDVDEGIDGLGVLSLMREEGGRFYASRTVANVLGKVPDSILASIIDDSLSVAVQSNMHRASWSGLAMVSSMGLPDAAMEALRDVVVADAADGSVRAREGGSGRTAEMVYLPQAGLVFDQAGYGVVMRWPAQRFPERLAGYRADYVVDGRVEASATFEAGVGRSSLPEVRIPVGPRSRYEVEIRLMAPDGAFGTELAGSLEQSFARSKPGCFEFVKGRDGLFKLRRRGERITRPRRVAYVVERGRTVVPGPGMRPVSSADAAGDWEGTLVQLFDVDPGSSGSVVDDLTGREVASWREGYSAHVDKARSIGWTEGGLDLYGVVPNSHDTNSGLPDIRITAYDGDSALRDLVISCDCDGAAVSVPRRVLYDDAGDGGPVAIALELWNTAMIPRHVERCEIVARQASAGNLAVFRYSFAIAPVQGFKLASADFEHGVGVADYAFQACEDIFVADANGSVSRVGSYGAYRARTLLADEELHLKLESGDGAKVTDAVFALAGIEVTPPAVLARISRERPVCLADALALGRASGIVGVEARGRRNRRVMYAALGLKPVFYADMRSPCSRSFNVLSDFSDFVAAQGVPGDIPLTLHICYGDDVSDGRRRRAWADVELLRCERGVGFSEWRLVFGADGAHALALDGELGCAVHVTYTRRKKLLAEVDVAAGSSRIPVPPAAVSQLDAGRAVKAAVAPCGLFGAPKAEYAQELEVKRKGK